MVRVRSMCPGAGEEERRASCIGAAVDLAQYALVTLCTKVELGGNL